MEPSFWEKLTDNNQLPADVPEGYFEQLPDRVLSRIHRGEAASTPSAAPVRRWALAPWTYAAAAVLCGAVAYVLWPRTEPSAAEQDPLALLQQESPENVLQYVEENAYEYANGDRLLWETPPDTIVPQNTGNAAPQPLPSVAELKKIDVAAELDRLDEADLLQWFDQNPQEIKALLEDE